MGALWATMPNAKAIGSYFQELPNSHTKVTAFAASMNVPCNHLAKNANSTKRTNKPALFATKA
jgi:hypothetical protein